MTRTTTKADQATNRVKFNCMSVTYFDGGVKTMIRFIINLFWPTKKRCAVTLIWKAQQKNKAKNKQTNKRNTREVLSKTKDLSISSFPFMKIMAPN